MLESVKVMDVELSPQLRDIEGLSGYAALQALVRLHGRPVGYVTVPVQGGRCPATNLIRAILDQHGSTIIRRLVRDRLDEGPLEPDGLGVEDWVRSSTPVYRGPQPLVTAAVCTRDRTDNLTLCLDALTNLTYSNLDLLVVDNAPKDDATERLVCTRFPQVRYVCEPRPGLNWARNRAIVEAQGQVIAFTDDDAVVDPGWVSALACVFAENPEVMAVTGLVVPYELETEAQVLFEAYGGFGRGFRRRWYCLDRENHKGETWHIGAGAFGTGANMAFRRHLFEQIGGFDPALDVGTVTNGGGDLEMFFRVLHEGYALIYEPSAMVRHRHRRDYSRLKTQLTNHGIGLYSYLMRSALAYPSERSAIVRLGIRWLWGWNIRRLLKSLIRPGPFPRELILAELRGSFMGLARYQRARRCAKKIAEEFGPVQDIAQHKESVLWPGRKKGMAAPAPEQVTGRRAGKGVWRANRSAADENPVAVRTIDLSQPLCALTDVSDYTGVRVYVCWSGRLVGRLDIANCRKPVSAACLRDAVVDNLTRKLLEPGHHLKAEAAWDKTLAALSEYYMPAESTATGNESVTLSSDMSVSVVIATRDRPDDLRDCLSCLQAQATSRPVEIVVVDNHPASGLIPPVAAEFPGVILVSEPRKGLSYARNKGIVASSGDIVIAVDDDVTMPANWLEKLVAPFARSDVMAVTGNVLPFELETEAQRLFEEYGGLGRGFEPFEANRDWFASFRFRAVPTWKLGATANAAFRATIFEHPEIGLMDEALGVGTPTGCSEDTYLFYRILKAGYAINYEPQAYVWHKHRRQMAALRRQLYGYSKGHVAYHLTTLIRDRDLRAMRRLAFGLPKAHLWRINRRLRRKSIYPLSLIIIEMLGNLAGPIALWRSRLRVKREGQSEPYILASQRPILMEDPLLVGSFDTPSAVETEALSTIVKQQ